jgi:hypothetical protein
MLNLTVLGYILPTIDDELMIKHIKSYGEDFWKNVKTDIIFRTKINKKLSDIINLYGIKYIDGIDEYWIPTIISQVEKTQTDYIEVFLEDKLILDIDKFIYHFKVLELNNLDFMPSCLYKYWNTLANWISGYTKVFGDEEFFVMKWGTNQSVFSKINQFNKIINTTGSPFPVVTGGVYKKSFFLETANRVKNSEYWKIIERNPDYFSSIDWAKNPKIPHSHEVWWKHNEDTEFIEYDILIPKDNNANATINDPKDKSRFHLE